MSNDNLIHNHRSSDFLPGFSDALVGLVDLYLSVENSFCPGQDVPDAYRDEFLGDLDRFCTELSEITSVLDDDDEYVEAKKRHIQVFRAVAGQYVWQAPFFSTCLRQATRLCRRF